MFVAGQKNGGDAPDADHRGRQVLRYSIVVLRANSLSMLSMTTSIIFKAARPDLMVSST
jgi:hypothetical protein